MYIIILIILFIKRKAIRDWFVKKYGPNCWPTNRKLFVYTAIVGFACGLVYIFKEMSADDDGSDTLMKVAVGAYMLGAAYFIVKCYLQTKTSADKREVRCRYWLTAGLGFLILVVTAAATIWAFVLVAILFILKFTNMATGFFPGVPDTSVSTPSVPTASGKEESTDRPYTPLLDPYGGDDGGVMDGNTRVPLHDNGDGTMRDDRGNTFKRDGNDVRKL
ncbi:MAG: hypothetical protein J6P99_00705 [Paludibacteraceae bacterium]|nr:hypothetical protein [Paludibacteraceae bacterium]